MPDTAMVFPPSYSGSPVLEPVLQFSDRTLFWSLGDCVDRYPDHAIVQDFVQRSKGGGARRVVALKKLVWAITPSDNDITLPSYSRTSPLLFLFTLATSTADGMHCSQLQGWKMSTILPPE